MCYNSVMTITSIDTCKKADLLALTLPQLQQWLVERGEAGFRARQLYHWLYRHLTLNFSAMTDLPQALRARLVEEASLGKLTELPEVTATRIRHTR